MVLEVDLNFFLEEMCYFVGLLLGEVIRDIPITFFHLHHWFNLIINAFSL